jgi:hypothetical protein
MNVYSRSIILDAKFSCFHQSYFVVGCPFSDTHVLKQKSE